MPNIKSAIKRVKVAEKKTLRNKIIKSNLKTSIKNFNESLTKDDANIINEYSKISKTIDKAVSKGILHKNTAARKKSKLAKKVNSLAN